MNRYIDFVLRWPKTVLLVLAVITIILTPGISKLEFDNSVEAFLPKDDHEYLYYNTVRDIYGDSGRFLIMAVSDDDLWSFETFRELDNFFTDLEEYEDFDEDKEKDRLERFDTVMSRGEVPYNVFLQQFNDDPTFRRLLKRKIDKHFAKIDRLDGGDFKSLRKEILHSHDLKRAEMIDDIISPLTAQDITGENDTLEAYYLIEKSDDNKRIIPVSEKETADFRKKLERNPAFERGIYSRDPESGKITDFGVIIKFNNKGDRNPIAYEILEIAESYRGLNIISQGMPVVYIWINKYLHRDLFTFIPIVLLVVIIVFYINFRTIRGVLLPFVSLAMGMFWILGLMGYLGYKITALGVSIPVLMIAVGSSYSIHILNQYYADFDMISEKGKLEGLRLAMTHISLTVLLAGITTFIAFMTLVTSRLTGIRVWGSFSAFGVIFAVFISSSLIPAGLALLPHKSSSFARRRNRKTMRITMVERIIELMTKGAVHHHRMVIIAVIVFIVLSIIGISRIKVETTFLSYFKENDPIRVSARIIGEKFGGNRCLNILIDSGEVEGVKNPEFLMTLETLRRWLESDENVDLNIGRTDVFSDYIKTMNMAMNNDDISFYSIPENHSDILDYLEIYSGDDENSDGRVDEFEPYVDYDFRTCDILARLCQRQGKPIGTAEINHIVHRISDHLENNLPENYSYSLTGHPMINVKLAHYIITGQLNSLFLSIIVIGIIVSLLFYHFKAGLIALIPMSVAVIFNFGIMGWLGIKLDLATSIIAAITIGIGVDDTIHFLNTFRHNRKKGCTVDETIEKTLAVSGKAIIFTSIALIFGFSVLVISSFIPVILFGILMATTMVTTTIGALLILPATIKTTGIELIREKQSESRISRYLNIGKLFGLEEEN